ncbi:hypothetical protein [Desulfoscipio sp. XC116]
MRDVLIHDYFGVDFKNCIIAPGINRQA